MVGGWVRLAAAADAALCVVATVMVVSAAVFGGTGCGRSSFLLFLLRGLGGLRAEGNGGGELREELLCNTGVFLLYNSRESSFLDTPLNSTLENSAKTSIYRKPSIPI